VGEPAAIPKPHNRILQWHVANATCHGTYWAQHDSPRDGCHPDTPQAPAIQEAQMRHRHPAWQRHEPAPARPGSAAAASPGIPP